MYETIYEYILSAKYISIFLLMFTFPTESVMPAVGYAASIDRVWLPGAILVGAAGTTLGSIMIYGIARLISQDAVNMLVRKYGRWMGLTQKSIERAGRWFDRNAKATVFVGKFVPGLRSAVSLSAGFRRMPFMSYVICTILGGIINSTILAVLGYMAIARFDELGEAATGLSIAAAASFLLALVLLLFWRRYKS